MSAPKLYTEDELRAHAKAAQDRRRALNGDHVRAIEQRYREKNREKAAAWREANKGKQKAYFQSRYQRQKEAGLFSTPEAKARDARYYEKNKAHIDARISAYKSAHPEVSRNATRKRRARIRGDGGSFSRDIEQILLVMQRGKCANCRKKLERFDLDHIVPIARGGRNVDSNAQLLCPTCNRRKHSKDPIAFAQEQGRLL